MTASKDSSKDPLANWYVYLKDKPGGGDGRKEKRDGDDPSRSSPSLMETVAMVAKESVSKETEETHESSHDGKEKSGGRMLEMVTDGGKKERDGDDVGAGVAGGEEPPEELRWMVCYLCREDVAMSKPPSVAEGNIAIVLCNTCKFIVQMVAEDEHCSLQEALTKVKNLDSLMMDIAAGA